MTGSRGRDAAALGTMAAACAGLGAATLLATPLAAALILAAGGGIAWSILRRLAGLSRSPAALVWSGLPLIEAAAIARFAGGATPIAGVVAAIFAIWGAIGCLAVFRRRDIDKAMPDKTATPVQQRIMMGSELT